MPKHPIDILAMVEPILRDETNEEPVSRLRKVTGTCANRMPL